jgi:ferredoxin-type protein NapF
MEKPVTASSRRAFLFGARAPQAPVHRPPWSVADFTAACTGCGDCLKACPESILVLDAGHRPRVDFTAGQGACTFCAACADVCTAPAFLDADERALTPPWLWQATITDACLTHTGVMCQSCKDACGENAIRFAYATGRVAQPIIDAARCTGCGACAAPCPVTAIAFQTAEPTHAA